MTEGGEFSPITSRCTTSGGVAVKQGFRLIIVERVGVLVPDFQLTENALAQAEAFVAVPLHSIEDIDEEES